MPVKLKVKIDEDDMVRYLLYQQFYYGADKIFGRTKDCSEYIYGAGDAIEEFYNLLTKNIRFIDRGKHRKYLEFYNKNIFPVPIDDIMNKYNDYKDTLGSEMGRKMTLTVIVGESLSETQAKCFKESIRHLIDGYMEKMKLKPEQRADIKKKVKVMYGKNNPFIGMIYSLGFMKLIAKKIKHQVIEQKSEQLLQKYYAYIYEDIK